MHSPPSLYHANQETFLPPSPPASLQLGCTTRTQTSWFIGWAHGQWLFRDITCHFKAEEPDSGLSMFFELVTGNSEDLTLVSLMPKLSFEILPHGFCTSVCHLLRPGQNQSQAFTRPCRSGSGFPVANVEAVWLIPRKPTAHSDFGITHTQTSLYKVFQPIANYIS